MIIKDKFHCFSKKRGINFTMLKKKSSGDLVYLFMIFFKNFIYILLYIRGFDLFLKFIIFICLKKKNIYISKL